MKKNNKGFSLVELIVVIAIMAILAAVAIPTFAGFITKAQKSNDEAVLNDLKYAVELAKIEYEMKDVNGAAIADENADLSVVISGGKITDVKIGNSVIYNSTATNGDPYQFGEVLDMQYEFEVLSGTFTPDTDGDGHWNDITPVDPAPVNPQP